NFLPQLHQFRRREDDVVATVPPCAFGFCAKPAAGLQQPQEAHGRSGQGRGARQRLPIPHPRDDQAEHRWSLGSREPHWLRACQISPGAEMPSAKEKFSYFADAEPSQPLGVQRRSQTFWRPHIAAKLIKLDGLIYVETVVREPFADEVR